MSDLCPFPVEKHGLRATQWEVSGYLSFLPFPDGNLISFWRNKQSLLQMINCSGKENEQFAEEMVLEQFACKEGKKVIWIYTFMLCWHSVINSRRWKPKWSLVVTARVGVVCWDAPATASGFPSSEEAGQSSGMERFAAMTLVGGIWLSKCPVTHSMSQAITTKVFGLFDGTISVRTTLLWSLLSISLGIAPGTWQQLTPLAFDRSSLLWTSRKTGISQAGQLPEILRLSLFSSTNCFIGENDYKEIKTVGSLFW